MAKNKRSNRQNFNKPVENKEEVVDNTETEVTEDQNNTDDVIETQDTVTDNVVEEPTVTEEPVVEETSIQEDSKIEKAFKRYVAKTATNIPNTATEGAREQYRFWLIVKDVLNSDPSEFHAEWGKLLKLAKEELNGILAAKNAYRFLNGWSWSGDEQSAFHLVTHIIMITADPETRVENIAGIQFKALSDNKSVNDTMISNLSSFYNI